MEHGAHPEEFKQQNSKIGENKKKEEEKENDVA